MFDQRTRSAGVGRPSGDAWVAGNSPEYRWLIEEMRRKGLNVVASFNDEFDRFISQARGGTIAFAARNGAVTVNSAALQQTFGPDWETVSAAAACARSHAEQVSLRDGTTVLVYPVDDRFRDWDIVNGHHGAAASRPSEGDRSRNYSGAILDEALNHCIAVGGFDRRIAQVHVPGYFSVVALDDGSVGAGMDYSKATAAERTLLEQYLRSQLPFDPLLMAAARDKSIDPLLRTSLLTSIASAMTAKAIRIGGDADFVVDPPDYGKLFEGARVAAVVGFGGFMEYLAVSHDCVDLRIIDLELDARRREMEAVIDGYRRKRPDKRITIYSTVTASGAIDGVDTVSITASALCNGTMEKLLDTVGAGRRVVVQGQSGAIHPAPFFNRGASAVVTTQKPSDLPSTAWTARLREVLESGLQSIVLTPRR